MNPHTINNQMIATDGVSLLCFALIKSRAWISARGATCCRRRERQRAKARTAASAADGRVRSTSSNRAADE